MPRGRQIGETPRHPWLQPAPRLALGADGATGPRLQVGGAGKFVEACLQVAADCAATAYPGGAVRSAGRPAQLTPATDRIYEVFSRVIDLAVAAVAVILASPIMLLAAMVIRGTSRGPVLFRQPRAGRNRASFVMYKFRTMYAGADDDKELFRRHNSLPTGPCFKMKDDPRVTTIGRW